MKRLLRQPFKYFIERFREKRRQLLFERFDFEQLDRKADLGGYDGSHFGRFVDDKFFLIEPSMEGIQKADRTQVIPIQIGEECRIPLRDQSIDFLFCNSVIEHATGPKETQTSEPDGEQFHRIARRHQQRLAREIQRVAKSYWVQTPSLHFPLETHTWLPFVQYLPRREFLRLIRLLDRFWIKSTSGDLRLLSKHEMISMFPEATVETRSFLGFEKSLIAYQPTKHYRGDAQ